MEISPKENRKGTKTVRINAANFEAEVLNSARPVVVDFWTDARGLGQMLEEVATECAEETKIAHVDVNRERELGAQFNIGNTPTVLYFAKGAVRDRLVGVISKGAIVAKLRDLQRKWDDWRNFRAERCDTPPGRQRPEIRLIPDAFGLLPWRLDHSRPPGW